MTLLRADSSRISVVRIILRSSGGSFGSSGGSLVATPDCKTAVLGSNPAISPAYSKLLS
jgi:hypothetical protein